MTFSECKSDYMAPLPWLKTLQWLPTALWIKAVSARWRWREGLVWSDASVSSRVPHRPLAVPVAPPGAPQASALPPSPPGSVPSLRNASPRSVTKLTHPRHRTHAHSLLKKPSPAPSHFSFVTRGVAVTSHRSVWDLTRAICPVRE